MIPLVIGLTKRSIDVLLELPFLEGLSAYMISRRLSRKLGLASSTTKFALKRLEASGLIENIGLVYLTTEGKEAIVKLKQVQPWRFEEPRKPGEKENQVYLWCER